MLKYYIKIAWRNLIRNKRNSIIILSSLVIAFSFTNLLVSFITHETNTDKFHGKKDRIYRLFSDDPMDSDRRIRSIPNETREYISQNYAEIEEACNVSAILAKGVILKRDNQRFTDIMVLNTNPSFFGIFDYPFLEGNPTDALNNNDGIVLTKATAQKIFGNPPYLNQTIELHRDTTRYLVEVTGVLEEITGSTQLKFDALVSGTKYQSPGMPGSSFLLTQAGVDIHDLVHKINRDKDVPSFVGMGEATYSVESLPDAYFNQERVQVFERSQSKRFIWICRMVILLICFAAGFNFVNLFIIGMTSRTKELGVRQILGASKVQIGAASYIEIGLYVLISFLLSIPITAWYLPYFNTAFGAHLPFSYLTSPEVVGLILILIVMIGLILATYLAYHLKRLDTVRLLQNREAKKLKINRSFFTAQFVITVCMIISSTIVIRQLNYIKNKPLGFNRNLMELKSPGTYPHPGVKVLKNKLLQYPELHSRVATSNGNPLMGAWKLRLELDDGSFYTPSSLSGDNDLPKILHLEILKGEPYRGKGNGLLVNEKLVTDLELKDPIGKQLPGYSKPNSTISGIVRDFNVQSLKHEIPPYFISYSESPSSLLVDISESELSDLLPMISESWYEVYPENSFEYTLIDDQLMAMHEKDARFMRILIAFALASIFISCFGLYGIAAFTTVQRAKEIGVRKVLGASIANIMSMLARDYTKWVAIGFLIATPVAWYAMQQWLANFAYHIEIGPGTFLVTGLVSLMLVVFTIGGLSVRAAMANPTKSLRNE